MNPSNYVPAVLHFTPQEKGKFYIAKNKNTMYPVALSFKPQGKGDESITHSAEVR